MNTGIKRMIGLVVGLMAGVVQAAIVIGDFSSPYTQNFNSLPAPATGSGEALAWVNNSTIAGWYQNHSNPNENGLWSYAVTPSSTPGLVASGGWSVQTSVRFANIGPVDSTDRAIGMSRQNSTDGSMGAVFENDSGKAMTGFSLGYIGEQWRRNATNDMALHFEYRVLSSEAGFDVNSATSSWTRVSALQFTSLVNGGALNLDGNYSSYRTTISPVTVNVSVADGQFLAVRWYEDRNKADGTSTSSYSHGLAIDDVSFQAIPEPATIGMLGLGALVALLFRRATK